MTREELAMRLLDALEDKATGLVHPWDWRFDHVDYGNIDVAEIVINVTNEWSRLLWLKGRYGYKKPDKEALAEQLIDEARDRE